MKARKTFFLLWLTFSLVLLLGGYLGATKPKSSTPLYSLELYQALRWRCIGPFRGGRVTAVAGVPGHPLVFYMGATGGGVWKTEDAGLTWKNISDGFFKTGSVGAIAVAEADPNVIYVGMGEAPIRGNVSHGDGIYKSTDSGQSWHHLGLAETRHISRIRIHPRNPELVYVAALGHVYGPNKERGVYRSRDGGRTWEKILYRDERTGAIDLILDPTNPRIIYAALWEAHRTPYSLVSGGPGSGLFKSTDGGDTWEELTRRPGMPRGIIGKIGVTVSPAKPGRVWAIVEAKEGGVFRSDDGGQTWVRVNADRRLRQRAWYYSRIYAHPRDPETVFVLNTRVYKSVDGGRTYTIIRTPHGDNHDLWINPDQPEIMVNGNDGGACVTLNGGLTWSPLDNQPTAQFYHVSTDNHFPYRVLGAQQDNSTVRIASRTTGAGIGPRDWEPVGGGESGHVVARHDNPDIVYAGSYGGLITRWDARTKQARVINPWPDNPMGWGAAQLKFRFQWTAPIWVSRFDSNVLYHAAQVLFKSTDEGQSWEIISPDLTTNDKSKQGPSGGPITKDNTSVEYYCTIFALAESYHDPHLLWVGTDDGLVHLTRDGGKTWENITPKQLPPWSLISMIEVSTFSPGKAYLAVDRHRLNDFKPYIYKTEDFGQTWKKITNGLPPNTFIRVVREDPGRQGLLYAGSETGVFVSFDDGEHWQSLQLNLPIVPIRDLVVKDNDLVAATHGRSFWILDDLTPLHQLTSAVAQSRYYLFKPRTAYRLRGRGFRRSNLGENPPSGSVIYYYLREVPQEPVRLEFFDAQGKLIRSFSSQPAPAAPIEERSSFFSSFPVRVPVKKGMNRFVWDMRYPGAVRVPGAVLWAGLLSGPVAVPGTYRVKLSIGDWSMTQEWEWKKDPRVEASQEDLLAQFDLLIKIRDKLSEVNRGIIRLRSAKKQLQEYLEKIKDYPGADEVVKAGRAIIAHLQEVENVLIQSKSKSPQDPLNYPIRLDNKIAALAGVVASADARPTDQAVALFGELSFQADEQLKRLKTIFTAEIAAFNRRIKEAGIPAIIIKD
jgi:photosystem II stability/assembly factor-like uncharacterized protein